MFEKSIDIIQSGVGSAFPCAAVAIGAGKHVFERRFIGKRQLYPTVLPVTEDTLFDLASLSKLVATTMVALKLIEKEKLSPDDKISRFINYTGNFSDCTIRHLMTHTSGMPAGIPLFKMNHMNEDPIRTILDADRLYAPGDEVCYSCMGYIVLQRILEKAENLSLDKLTEKYVFAPLGMKNACYNPAASGKNRRDFPVAATEKYPHNGEWATGHVHDENAYYLGGVSGNAGVFATLDDMITFAIMCSQKGISASGERYLSASIFDSAVINYTQGKKEARGLGFQLKENADFPGGTLFSSGSFGHTGFTGTSLYIDHDTGLWGLLLTNAVHLGRENRNEYFSVRRSFYDMIISEYNMQRDADFNE